MAAWEQCRPLTNPATNDDDARSMSTTPQHSTTQHRAALLYPYPTLP
jgi:hypothetical protein